MAEATALGAALAAGLSVGFYDKKAKSPGLGEWPEGVGLVCIALCLSSFFCFVVVGVLSVVWVV